MAWALWVAVVSAQLAASDRGYIRARALRLSEYGSRVEREAHGQVLSEVRAGLQEGTRAMRFDRGQGEEVHLGPRRSVVESRICAAGRTEVRYQRPVSTNHRQMLEVSGVRGS
jgi:hypothetical protein